MTDPVEIVDYDPSWPAEFERLAERALAALGPLGVRAEHLGSTAVPGLAAKPVIDLALVIRSPDDLPGAVSVLGALGYEHEGDRGIPGLEAFAWPVGERRHHLYVCAEGAAELARMRAFRDRLRADPDEAAAYERLKRELAARHRHDRTAYTDAKTEFVTRVSSAG
ncbi:MAG TPA: GrpB family protein [Gaiellaceae bacterium]|nr:GrpB family protein [Gaiellaceae bacterium]